MQCWARGLLCAVTLLAGMPGYSLSFVIFGNTGLASGFRWDARPLSLGGFERSLQGGLRYSLQGGSYQSYRDQFQWQGTPPSVAAFQASVENAFGAWSAIDPATGFGTSLRFVSDFATPVDPALVGGIRRGAEIDLFAAIDATTWNPGDNGTRGECFFNAFGSGTVTLTSGTTGYSAFSISGADITINNNPGAIYNLVTFQTLLTHEIGHSLGFGDVDFPHNPTSFIDDNYNGSSAATALATLTNSFSAQINRVNPAVSPLAVFAVPNANPGVDTPGVDILMESNVPGALFTFNNPLRNDDWGGRQFLYPASIPGDANLDGMVTGADFTIWGDRFGSSNALWSDADFNGDNLVTGADFTIWADHFGESIAPTAVPEPASFLLVMLAGCGFAGRRFRRLRRDS